MRLNQIADNPGARKERMRVGRGIGSGKGLQEDGNKRNLRIELKYYEGEPVIKAIDRVSKPGRRVYSAIKDLGKVRGGLGISILSTPRGVMSDVEARAANVGGEVLCRVF